MTSISTPHVAPLMRIEEVAAHTPLPIASSLPDVAEDVPSFHGLAGRSPVIRQLILQMQRMAPALKLATLEGEDGSGATLAARALHAAGPASGSPFVPYLATHFFESGAAWPLEVLNQASGGMLFLDRVHLLSPGQQESLANFLRWWENRHSYGGEKPSATPSSIASDTGRPVQIVFSTAISLREPRASSGFRADLASRLGALRFRLPPLRERREDVPLLAQIFIQRFARANGNAIRGLGPGTVAPLLRYGWPGNVRELEEVINAAALETKSQWIRPIDLPPLPAARHGASHAAADEATGIAANGSDNSLNASLTLDQAIFLHVNRVLDRTRRNKLRAARILGISRSTLYRILAGKAADSSETS